MNITLLAPEYLPVTGGGIVTFYRFFLPELVRRGCRVRVIYGSGSSAEDQVYERLVDGVSVEPLERARLDSHFKTLTQLSSMPGLRRHLAAAWAMWEQASEGGDADIIEACDWGLLFIPPVLSGTHPVITQMHGSVGQIDNHDPLCGQRGPRHPRKDAGDCSSSAIIKHTKL